MATLKVATLPSSAVSPEMLVISNKSLPETDGAPGVGSAGDSSSLTLKVAVVPSSTVLPEMLVML